MLALGLEEKRNVEEDRMAPFMRRLGAEGVLRLADERMDDLL
jgi:hypothetical protein